jgi:SpoVK/Ycf46/Vps4 family AAA+-type ATPase
MNDVVFVFVVFSHTLSLSFPCFSFSLVDSCLPPLQVARVSRRRDHRNIVAGRTNNSLTHILFFFLDRLLNQMDGFDQTTNIKVIMATNRADTLDPALLRPGRLDRKIEFPNPDRRQKRMVFQAATSKMNLSDEMDLEDYVNRSEKVSAADISSICSEAGLQAVRENRYVVLPKDFDQAYKKVVNNRDKEFAFYTM